MTQQNTVVAAVVLLYSKVNVLWFSFLVKHFLGKCKKMSKWFLNIKNVVVVMYEIELHFEVKMLRRDLHIDFGLTKKMLITKQVKNIHKL